MSKEEFTNLAELDSYLLTLKGDKASESPVDEVNNDVIEDVAELDDKEAGDDKEQEELLDLEDLEDEEEVEEPKEEPKPKPKRTKEEKADYKFAQLRKEAHDAKKALEDREEIVRALMKEAGIADYEAFKQAIKENLSEKEMKQKGYTKEQFSELEQLRQEKARLERELNDRTTVEVRTKAQRFDNLVESYSDRVNMTKTEVYDILAESGYSIETLLAQPNPELLIKGALADKLIQSKPEEPKRTETKRFVSGEKKDNGKLTVDDLVKQDLDDFKKRKGYI